MVLWHGLTQLSQNVALRSGYIGANGRGPSDSQERVESPIDRIKKCHVVVADHESASDCASVLETQEESKHLFRLRAPVDIVSKKDQLCHLVGNHLNETHEWGQAGRAHRR